jgi:hypothetical protein
MECGHTFPETAAALDECEAAGTAISEEAIVQHNVIVES